MNIIIKQRKIQIFLACYVFVFSLVRRLNGVVSLFTVCEELFHPASLFWSHDDGNRGIRLFHEQFFELSRRGGPPLSGQHMDPPFFLKYRIFRLFLERLSLLSNQGREPSSLLVLCTIKCLILINLFCFLPNILCQVTLFGIT